MKFSQRQKLRTKKILNTLHASLKEACNEYGLKLDIYREDEYLSYNKESYNAFYEYKTNVVANWNFIKNLEFQKIYLESIINSNGRLYFLWLAGDTFNIQSKDFQDLKSFFIEKFKQCKILTGDEMIIKDIIE